MPAVNTANDEPPQLKRYEVRPGVVLKLSAADAKTYKGARELKFGEAPSKPTASTLDNDTHAKRQAAERASRSQPASGGKPTKAQLLERAVELGITDVGDKTKNDDIAAAIAKAEADGGTGGEGDQS